MTKLANRSPGNHRKLSGVSLTNRSGFTNGNGLAEDADGRSAWAGRFRDLMFVHEAGLGDGAVGRAEGSVPARFVATG